jgi:hypothetical protein
MLDLTLAQQLRFARDSTLNLCNTITYMLHALHVLYCIAGFSGQQIVLTGSQLRQPSALVVEEVLQRLLHVAVSDPNPTIRQTLLRALDQRFDRFLCQAHHLQTLFLLMGDEDFLIRLDAVTVSYTVL